MPLLPLCWLLLLFLLVPAGCRDRVAPNIPERLTVVVTPYPGSAPFYLAQDKGLLVAQGLNLDLKAEPSGHLGLEAVLAGRADLATVGDTPIAQAALAGRPFKVVATLSEIQRSTLLICRRDRGIESAKDLKGKSIGLVVGTTADFYLHILLTVNYLDSREVRLVDLAPEQLVAALLSGQVDAVSAWSPYTHQLLEQLGDQALVLHDPSLYTMTWNLVAGRDFAEQHQDALQRLLRALLQAEQMLSADPAAAQRLCLAHLQTDPKWLAQEWPDFGFGLKLKQSLLLNLEDQARWLSRRQPPATGHPPNFLEFIDTRPLNSVAPEAVRLIGYRSP